MSGDVASDVDAMGRCDIFSDFDTSGEVGREAPDDASTDLEGTGDCKGETGDIPCGEVKAEVSGEDSGDDKGEDAGKDSGGDAGEVTEDSAEGTGVAAGEDTGEDVGEDAGEDMGESILVFGSPAIGEFHTSSGGGVDPGDDGKLITGDAGLDEGLI